MRMVEPRKKRYKQAQRKKKRYAKNREDLQQSGVIPTTSDGAVRSEVVNPYSQDEQRFPGLDRLAVLNDGKGWNVPESVRRKVIEKNAEVLYERRVIYHEGQEIELPPDRKAINEASKILLTADQRQYERDNPEEAGKAKGSSNQVNVFDWDALAERLRKKKEQEAVENKELPKQLAEHISEEQQLTNGQVDHNTNGTTDAS